MKRFLMTFAALTIATPTIANGIWNAMESYDFCYERAYTKTHMTDHPKQTVTHIRLWSEKRLKFPDSTQASIISAKFKGDKLTYENIVSCYQKDHGANCYGDCDGGGLHVENRRDGSVFIRFDKESKSVLLGSGCGSEDEKFRHLGEGEDDKVFKLFPVDPQRCKNSKIS